MTKKEAEEIYKKVSIRSIAAILCADIDIKLLLEKDQKTTKKKVYTPRQIRTQLKKSVNLLCGVLKDSGYDVYKEINPSFPFIPKIKKDTNDTSRI